MDSPQSPENITHRNIMAVNPHHRIVRPNLISDQDFQNALPFDNNQLFFNPGHSTKLYAQLSLSDDESVYEVSSQSKSVRYLGINITSLVSNHLFQNHPQNQEIILRFLTGELESSMITFLRDNQESLKKNPPQNDAERRQEEKGIENIKASINLIKSKIQHEAMKNFLEACQKKDIDLSRIPSFEKFAQTLYANSDLITELESKPPDESKDLHPDQ